MSEENKEVSEVSTDQPLASAVEETKEVVAETATAVEAKVEEAKEEVAEAAAAEVNVHVERPSPLASSDPDGDFNWDDLSSKGFADTYSTEEKARLEQMYAETLKTVTEKEVVMGKVVGISDRDVILNIGFKSDGLVSASEFRDIPDLKIGDEVEVFIEEQENALGQLSLSRKIAKIVRSWALIKEAYENDTILEGMVKRRTKGGLIMDISGVEAFLPGSQIDVKPIRDFDVFVGKMMEVKVVKINFTNDNVVVSHKVLIEKDLEKQRGLILNNLEKGQVLEGVIKNMTNFGVFIDLGGVDGLLHITDISWGRINHPEEVLELDQKVNVVVLDFDDNKKRISLGMKQLSSHPWDSLEQTVEIGTKVTGSIVNVADYGAFLEILPGVEGLIHVSEMSWSQHLRNPSDFIKVGDKVEAVVLTLDRDERKMSLGIKQLSEDPWTKQDMVTKYAVGATHTGIVRNLTNFGLFLELEEGIDGLVHVSDLSWTKKIKHPSEFVKVNDNLEVKVLELDVDNRRLALGHKQLEENPWETFASVFNVGSLHQCTVINKNEKGAQLELPYGVEGFAPTKHLKKEDGTVAKVGESLQFRVLEFSKDDKKIFLSHSNTYGTVSAATPAEKPASSTSRKPKSPKNASGVATDALGDIGGLGALKAQMLQSEKKEAEIKLAKRAEKKEDAPAKPVVEVKVEDAPAPEPVVEAPAEAKKEVKAKSEAKPDDLKKIEGIGPAIAKKLGEAGIVTFAELASTEVSKLKAILDAAGSRYKMHDPTTWPEQSKLAADGNWDELNTLQDNLKGGRPE